MPKDVYNLGRAGGLSAWEVYVRQSLLLNPDVDPLSEREWLAESIGMGTSMLLKINTGARGAVDYPLPSNSFLCAPNTIIGSFFDGEGGGADDNGWCSKVVSYGVGISNTSNVNPGNGSVQAVRLPKQDLNLDDTTKNRMMQYIKIQDAVVLQTGIWSDSHATDNQPAKTFIPDITVPPVLRIIFDSRVDTDFYILLSGFVNRAIVKGEVGFDMGSVIPNPNDSSAPTEYDAYHPENGDFLGPRLYPWANKVIFTYPQILTKILRDGFVSQSNYIKLVQNSEDQTETDIYTSTFEEGYGIKITETADADNQGLPKIKIASQVQSENAYLKVEQTDGKTKLTPSVPAHGKGIKITAPTTNGGQYTIESPIEAREHSQSYPKGPEYLHVKHNSDGSTELCPSYPIAGKGVQITDPDSPGQAYDIDAEIVSSGDAANYLRVTQNGGQATQLSPSKIEAGVGVQVEQPSSTGGNIEVSAEIIVEGNSESNAKYLVVDQSANGTTGIHVSPITAGEGVGLTQPATAGSEIKISSKVQSSNNYINVIQSTTNADGTPTTLQASQIKTQDYTEGSKSYPSRLVLQQPSSPGGDIILGTKINYEPHLGVAIYDDSANGIAHIGSPIGVAGTPRSAKAIKIYQSSGHRTDASFPTDVVTSENESATAAIDAIVDQVTNVIQLSEMTVDERLLKDYVYKRIVNDDVETVELKYDSDILTITYPSNPGGDIVFFIDIDEIIKRMKNEFATKDYVDQEIGKLKAYVDQMFKTLLERIYVGEGQNGIGVTNINGKTEFIKDWTFDNSIYEGVSNDYGKIVWPSEVDKDVPEGQQSKIPFGNVNIYSKDGSGETFAHSIRSRAGNSENDLRLK